MLDAFRTRAVRRLTPVAFVLSFMFVLTTAAPAGAAQWSVVYVGLGFSGTKEVTWTFTDGWYQTTDICEEPVSRIVTNTKWVVGNVQTTRIYLKKLVLDFFPTRRTYISYGQLLDKNEVVVKVWPVYQYIRKYYHTTFRFPIGQWVAFNQNPGVQGNIQVDPDRFSTEGSVCANQQWAYNLLHGSW